MMIMLESIKDKVVLKNSVEIKKCSETTLSFINSSLIMMMLAYAYNTRIFSKNNDYRRSN